MIEPGHLGADRCPGLLSPHAAEDGLLARIRVPGGRITAEQLAGLGRLAGRYGQPELQLTSRANVQLRGIEADRLDDLGSAVAALGLLPSPEHERVRNILGSPLAGLGVRQPLDGLITELDHAICGVPDLAELPARFLFALDDGSNDVGALRFDLALRRLPGGRALIMIGTTGEPVGTVVPIADAVRSMIKIARRFVELRRAATTGWHLRESDPGLFAPGMRPVGELADPVANDPVQQSSPPIGVVDGAASVLVPLARLSTGQVDALVSAAGSRQTRLILTPWRGVVLPGAQAQLPSLAAAGLITDGSSAWIGLTACVGSPGCARSAVDTRSTATELVALLDQDHRSGGRQPPPVRVHLSGCGRRCGRPTTNTVAGTSDVVDLVAPRGAADAHAALAGRSDHSDRPDVSTDLDHPTAGRT